MYSLIMDTNNDTNNVLEGGSAADHQDNTLRHTDKKSNDEQITLPPEVSKIYQYTPLMLYIFNLFVSQKLIIIQHLFNLNMYIRRSGLASCNVRLDI